MYRCSECGTEYAVKPDFCDCGNDVFIEVEDVVETTYQEEVKPQVRVKKTFAEQYPMLERFRQSLDPISVIIFCICILLSIASFIFIQPNQDEEDDLLPREEEVAPKKVADINSFWDNTPPKPEPKVVVQMEAPKPQIVAQNPPIVQPVKNISKNVQTPTSVKKQTAPKTVSKPKTTSSASTNTKTNTQTKPQMVSQPKPQTTQQTTKQTQPAQTPKPTVNVPVKQIKPVVQKTDTSAKELSAYKTGLRNTLFSRINFNNIYGDGSCEVVFSVSSSGKLINRSFSKQSTNGTLNDEVYSAIMATPFYSAPPSAYKGQVLHFSVTFKSGQFEVSLY